MIKCEKGNVSINGAGNEVIHDLSEIISRTYSSFSKAFGEEKTKQMIFKAVNAGMGADKRRKQRNLTFMLIPYTECAGKHRTQFQKQMCALNVRFSAVKSRGRIARYASASQRLKEAENIMMCAKHYVIWRKILYL